MWFKASVFIFWILRWWAFRIKKGKKSSRYILRGWKVRGKELVFFLCQNLTEKHEFIFLICCRSNKCNKYSWIYSSIYSVLIYVNLFWFYNILLNSALLFIIILREGYELSCLTLCQWLTFYENASLAFLKMYCLVFVGVRLTRSLSIIHGLHQQSAPMHI